MKKVFASLLIGALVSMGCSSNTKSGTEVKHATESSTGSGTGRTGVTSHTETTRSDTGARMETKAATGRGGETKVSGSTGSAPGRGTTMKAETSKK